MISARGLYHLVRADFLERTRRYSFLIVLGLTAWLGYLFVPAATANYGTLAMDNYRGVYNTPWIAGMVGIMTAVFVSLPGFYLVKGAVARDRQTGVGQILAATPLTRPAYMLGKWLSNFVVLAALVGLLVVVTAAMQWLRGEVLRLDPWALAQPFLFGALPAMAVVAAVAVLFDTLPFLRGGLGNVIYFFLWIFALVNGTVGLIDNDAGPQPGNDLFGVSYPLADMAAAVKARFPDYGGDVTIGFSIESGEQQALQTFVWEGQVWTPARIGARLAWVGVAAAMALGAAAVFDRFDASPKRRRTEARRGAEQATDDRQRSSQSKLPVRDEAWLPAPTGATAANRGALPSSGRAVRDGRLSSLAPGRFSFGRLLAAELRLLLKGQRWWWYAGGLMLVVAGAFNSAPAVRELVLPLTWLWPILIWSGLGCREQQHGTAPIVFSAARPVTRQMPAVWLAGALVAALTGAGAALTLLRAGDLNGLAAWTTGAAFIPALGLALGTLSGGSKLFEMVYVVLWYLGPMSGAPELDFLGARNHEAWPYYLAAAAALLAAAGVLRAQQLRR